MALPDDLPVVDHHCHLSPSGEGVAAAGRFRRAGGTHLFLTTQAYGLGPITRLEAYAEQFETTERLAGAVHRETGVSVYLVVAPYPVDLVKAAERIGLGPAQQLHEAALDLAGRWVEDGRAVALGEVGRPHFPLTDTLAAAAESLFDHALEVARDVGCPVVVHSEDLDAEGLRALAHRASAAQFPLHRLVKHYQRSLVPPDLNGEVVPSYLARRETCAGSLATPGPWFWETDFLDDPSRPGAVLDLETVPRRARALAERVPDEVERLRVPFVESIQHVYGFRPSTAEVGAA